MSLKTRLALAAGSSLALMIGLALAPSAAWAADECAPVPSSGTSSDGVDGVSDPTLNGGAPDSFECLAGTASSIAYSSSGDLAVGIVPDGDTNFSTIDGAGVNLTGNGADDVDWDSSTVDLWGDVSLTGPIIDVTSSTGAISIVTQQVLSWSGASHAVRATSTGGGDITIVGSSWTINGAGGQAAVEAVSNGGDISITNVLYGTTGYERGFLAQTNGAGSVSLNLTNGVFIDGVDGIAALDLTAGTGGISVVSNSGGIYGASGIAIRAVSTGGASIQILQGSVNGRVDFSGVTGSGVIFSIAGESSGNGIWGASGANTFSDMADTLNMLGTGDNSLAAGGSIDFGGGADIFNLAGTFTAPSSTIDFGVGADVFNIGGRLVVEGSMVDFGADDDALSLNSGGRITAVDATLNFGAGTDVFAQSGSLFANGVVAIGNLEAFNNTGSVYLGGGTFNSPTSIDGVADDILKVTSGVFTGSGDSRILFDTKLGAHGSQLGCSAPTVSDCIDFTGATTAGSTLLNVKDISYSVDGGTLNSVVTLVQGSTAAEHFTLDPASSYYAETPQGIAIRKPVVAYQFVYDAANHRHVLVGAPTDEVFQVGTFATSAQEAWRATTGSWLTRQADLRAAPGGLEASRGVWSRIGAQSGERDLATSYELAGLTFDYDLSQKQKIAHITFGADLVGGAGWVLGGMVGFVRSDVEFEAMPTEAVTSGFSGGVYASYVAGPLFVDATVNTNILHIKADAPAMGLGFDVPMKFDLKSLGGQVEAGWRFDTGSGLFVEPLAGVSYVVTLIEDAEVPGGSGLFDFEESKSLRLGGGARVGLDSELMGMAASYSLTGRYWNDAEGEGGAILTTASGSSATTSDDFSGGFSEVTGSLNLYSSDGGLSGFVNLGGKFADGYQAIDGAVGVRVRW